MTHGKRILLIQAHPDGATRHLCHALCDTYEQAARDAGHEVQLVDVSALDFPLLRSPKDWQEGAAPAALRPVQEQVLWAQHLVFFFPLWLGDMPALLKAFLEQIARPGFAFKPGPKGAMGEKGLTGRSARLVVTMGMPALVYRYIFRAHSVKSLERNVLGFVGIGPVHETLIGGVDGADEKSRVRWFETLRRLGATGE